MIHREAVRRWLGSGSEVVRREVRVRAELRSIARPRSKGAARSAVRRAVRVVRLLWCCGPPPSSAPSSDPTLRMNFGYGSGALRALVFP